MANRNDLFDFDASTSSNNDNVEGANCAENCAPSGINNAIRGLAAIIKRACGFKGSDIASAATTSIGAAGTALYQDITGTTAITALGTVAAGTLRWLQFDGALTLTHNATSLILPGGANITTAAGDVACFISEGSGNWRCVNYQSAFRRVAFSAHKNGTDQTGITSSTPTKITFGSESFDYGSCFASSTFTAPAAGVYRFTSNIHWSNDNAVDVEALQIFLYKNGVVHKFNQNNRSGSGASSNFLSVLVAAAAGDTFEIYGNKGGTGNGTIDGSFTRTYFMGEFVNP